MTLSSFKELGEGNIFHFDGATYMKFNGSNGHKCFMVKGFISNNHPENVDDESVCEKMANTFLEWTKEQK